MTGLLVHNYSIVASNNMAQTDEKQSFEHLLAHGSVVLCDYRHAQLPAELRRKKAGKVVVLTKQPGKYNYTGDTVVVRMLPHLSAIRGQNADVCFLDYTALKTLVVRFPKGASYIALRIAPRLSWAIAFFGLVRRLYRKELRSYGLRRVGGKLWLVVRHKDADGAFSTGIGLSEEVGIHGFLDFLRTEHISYVVLRFFERLPELHRKGGDLDILVSDEDVDRVRTFLAEHPGTLPIGLHAVSSLQNNRAKIAYYPPPIALGMLKRAVDGPAQSRIPAQKDAFLALAYHALYHKGFGSGLPSSIPGHEQPEIAENDYTGELRTMAQELGLEIDITMEALDDYLAQEGWRPKIDTLAKIAATNEWVWHRFFLQKSEEEIGLNVLILKRRAVEKGMMDTIIKMVEHEEFVVVRKKIFSEGEVPQVAGHLRGGDWKTGSDGTDAFLPAAVLVILDAHIVKLRGLGVQMHGDFDSRIRTLKNKLRKNFSDPSGNLIHSTDNTQQSWEYVEVCFPEAFQEVQQEIASYGDSSPEQSFFGRAISRLRLFPRYAKIQLRNAIFKRIMK